MSDRSDNKLTKKQKEAIAEQLASFFFDFWQNRNSNKKLSKEESSHCPNAGFSEEFSRPPGTMT
jgi:hypothetical protein